MVSFPSSVRRSAAALSVTVCIIGSAGALPTPAQADKVGRLPPTGSARACHPVGEALGFSDALDKVDVDGVRIGGLSSLARDPRTRTWASTVDNHGTDPSRIWFFRDLAHPRIVGQPLILRRPDGSPYDGTTADNEGLAVLGDGRFLVSSETEPSIRLFGRDGVEQFSLPVPARFHVLGTTPAGEATANATLEGLASTPDGGTVVAAMEGALSGDISSAGDTTSHRFLIYTRGHRGWTVKQIAYRAEVGQRVAEVGIDGRNLVVEEASFDPATGNAVRLYGVRRFDKATDVTRIGNLSATSRPVAVRKRLLADVVGCPSLGAPSKETQANPLLDNYEGMALIRRAPASRRTTLGVSLISDDNFSETQTTRVLRLELRPPGRR